MGNNVHTNMTFFFESDSDANSFWETLSRVKEFSKVVALHNNFGDTRDPEYLKKCTIVNTEIISRNMGILGAFFPCPKDISNVRDWSYENYGTMDTIMFDDGSHISKPGISKKGKEISIGATFQWNFPHKWIHHICDKFNASKCEINISGEYYDHKRLLIKKNDADLYRRLNKPSFKRLFKNR